MSNTHFFTTANPYVLQKIKRNDMMINSLELQNTILQKEILLNYRTSEVNLKKIDIIKKINNIESKQLQNFLQQNEEVTRDMYTETNELHVQNYENLKNEIIDLHIKCGKMLQDVIKLNDEIPKTLEYINVEYELSNNPEPNILE